MKHLFKSLGIEKYYIYEGKHSERLEVFIEVPHYTLEEADTALNEISMALKKEMVQSWKCLPSLSVPEIYNIVTLPYKEKIY